MDEKDHLKRDVKYAEQARNANNKTIFKNNVLTCQFLKNYSGIELFANIQPEDIEDVSEQYVALLGIEFEADTVKKVHIRDDQQGNDVYVLPLVEHKSFVDFDVAMQLLRYMVVIWYDYKKTQEGIKEGISKTKGFRYPLIIPIVYYEGAASWTAGLNLRDRIAFGDMMQDFIPNFTYHIFHVHEYSNEKLLKMQDEMSLVVMINKIQNAEDFSEFLKSPAEYVAKLYKNAPADIRDICLTIMWSLLMKMQYPTAEAEELMGHIRETNMGYLFENAADMNIQTARKERDEAKEKLDQANQQLSQISQELEQANEELTQTKSQLDEAHGRFERMVKTVIAQAKHEGKTQEKLCTELQLVYGLTEEEVHRYLKM